jgi:hypothetical protein
MSLMPSPSKRPKVARIARTRPVTYLGREHEYGELRDGKKILDRKAIGTGRKSISQASSELRETARRQGYKVQNPRR